MSIVVTINITNDSGSSYRWLMGSITQRLRKSQNWLEREMLTLMASLLPASQLSPGGAG